MFVLLSQDQIRVYTVCRIVTGPDQGLHCLPYCYRTRSGSTLFAVLSQDKIRVYTVAHTATGPDQCLHCLPYCHRTRSWSTLFAVLSQDQIRVYTVCRIGSIFWMHYCIVKNPLFKLYDNYSKFFSGVQMFPIFRYSLCVWWIEAGSCLCSQEFQ